MSRKIYIFALLQEAIGSEGQIIGVDLTDAMLDQARQRVAEHGWQNVELVQSDATQYEFPDRVGGIIAAFALSFIPDRVRVIQNGCRALEPGRKWVVLDMAGWLAVVAATWPVFLAVVGDYGRFDPTPFLAGCLAGVGAASCRG